MATGQFNYSEGYLLDKDLRECCICVKFAMYLERALVNTKYYDYIVDVEYNRCMQSNEYAKKRLYGRDAIVD